MQIIMVDLMNMQIISQILQLSRIYCTIVATNSTLLQNMAIRSNYCTSI